MKKIYTNRRLSIAATMFISCAVLFSILLYACKKPTEGIKVIVDSNTLFPSPTLVKFNNADSTSTNQPGNFPVTISGPGAKYVQLSSGGTDFKATSGLLSLALTKDANASASNPIIFTVLANIAGFAPIIQNITITNNNLSVFPIKAFEYARAAAGTSVINGVTTTLVAGALPSVYTLTTAKTSSMNEQATLSFPSGTQMMDANGVAITGTTLKSNIVQYGTGTDASLQSFPGGFTAPLAYKSDNTPIAGGVNFVTAGLLQINLDVNGTPVKKFSKPINVTVELNTNLVNFANNLPIQVGDVIPLWSMNETTGQWTNEGSATVILDGANRKAAQFTITHLSCWNLDWSWGAFGAYSTCGSSLAVNISTSDPAFKGGPYEITLQTPSGHYLGGLHAVTISNGFVATFASVPNIAQAKIVISGGIPYTRIQSSLFSPCSAGSVAVTVPVGTSNPINVNLDIKGLCNGKDVTILPTATFELYQQTGGAQGSTATYTDAGSFQILNGKGTTGLQVGKQYYFVTVYNGTQYKTDTFTVSKSDMAIPSSTSTLNAAAIYDATTNTLNVTGTIPVNCN